jgi:hypothetical protein
MSQAETAAREQIMAYCAGCKERKGIANKNDLGVYFDCPLSGDAYPPHTAAVVKDREGATWLRLEHWLLTYQLTGGLRWKGFWRRIIRDNTGVYLIVRCIYLIVALLGEFLPVGYATFEYLQKFASLYIAVILLFDILLSNTAIAFTSRDPAHPLRSVLFTLFSFFQLALCFSVLYGIMPGKFHPPLTFAGAIYFSVITTATVGYGDITPCPEAWAAQLIVMFEVFAGLFFLAVLIAIISNWANGWPNRRMEKTLKEILDRH